jgi:hypothetical protein
MEKTNLMNPDQAKLLLQIFRPGSSDEHDPLFSDALKATKEDQDLNAWYQQQKSFDDSVRVALQGDKPPHSLRDAILATRTSYPQCQTKANTMRFKWIASVAAMLFLSFGALELFLWENRHIHLQDATEAGFANAAMEITNSGIYFGSMSHNSNTLRKWLANHNSPHDFIIPEGLTKEQSLGCQSYFFDTVKVSLVCFDLGNNQVAHLFAFNSSALKNPQNNNINTYMRTNSQCLTWISGKTCYILTGTNISIEALKKRITDVTSQI